MSHSKYLKYKKKYLELLSYYNQLGGRKAIISINESVNIEFIEAIYLSLQSTNSTSFVLNKSARQIIIDNDENEDEVFTRTNLNLLLNLIPAFDLVLVQQGRTGGQYRKITSDIINAPTITTKDNLEIMTLELYTQLDEEQKRVRAKTADTRPGHVAPATVALHNTDPAGMPIIIPHADANLDALLARIKIDVKVPSSYTQRPGTNKYKIDSSKCKAFILSSTGRPVERRVLFDTGNHAYTLISQKYVTELNLERKPIIASAIQISFYNQLMTLIKKPDHIIGDRHDGVTLRHLVSRCNDFKEDILPIINTEHNDSMIMFEDIRIPSIIASALKIGGTSGVEGGSVLVSHYVTVHLNIPTSDRKTLHFTLDAFISNNDTLDLLISDKVITNLQILKYDCSGHTIEMITPVREMDDCREQMDLLHLQLLDPNITIVDRRELTRAFITQQDRYELLDDQVQPAQLPR